MGDMMKVYDFTVLFEPDSETGGYVVKCPSLPGCYSQGDTIEEAIRNIKEAILLCLEDMEAQKIPIPDTSNTFVGSVAVTL
jgi:antitoxin HicB